MTNPPSLSLTWHHDALPEMPDDNMHAEHVYLPMEAMLSRAVAFPFASPALVDADMLFQMLNDDVDAKVEEWWLAWHLEPCQDGVAGMVFGMPETWRTSMQESDAWGQVKTIVVDGYERLQAYAELGTASAVVSQDAEGLFFGFFDGEAWRGMRRLNVSTWQASADMEMIKSLEAMGFDAQQQPVIGIASDAIWQHLRDETWQTDGEVWESLPTRDEANLALSDALSSRLNFRHGRWSAQQIWQRWSFWQRSVMLMLATLMIWFAGTWYQLNQLDAALKDSQARIVAAFHEGLPQAPVMLDALAQLKQAAGGETSQVDTHFLSDLEHIGRVYQTQAWQLDALSLREGKTNMTGSVPSLEKLNQIQTALQQQLKQEVRIVDTQMAKNHVSFRLTW